MLLFFYFDQKQFTVALLKSSLSTTKDIGNGEIVTREASAAVLLALTEQQ